MSEATDKLHEAIVALRLELPIEVWTMSPSRFMLSRSYKTAKLLPVQ
jgi:hypothetical protein